MQKHFQREVFCKNHVVQHLYNRTVNLMKVFVLCFPPLEEIRLNKHKEPQKPKHTKDVKLETFSGYHDVRIF